MAHDGPDRGAWESPEQEQKCSPWIEENIEPLVDKEGRGDDDKEIYTWQRLVVFKKGGKEVDRFAISFDPNGKPTTYQRESVPRNKDAKFLLGELKASIRQFLRDP